jgi:predicted house-cleaning NTP pyrophosphatase (Maf/HAM1 superfamily)
MVKKRIILASTSPRRHELAKVMGLDFDIVPSDYEDGEV